MSKETSFIRHRQMLFPQIRYSPILELHFKRILINILRKPHSQHTMYFHRRTNNAITFIFIQQHSLSFFIAIKIVKFV